VLALQPPWHTSVAVWFSRPGLNTQQHTHTRKGPEPPGLQTCCVTLTVSLRVFILFKSRAAAYGSWGTPDSGPNLLLTAACGQHHIGCVPCRCDSAVSNFSWTRPSGFRRHSTRSTTAASTSIRLHRCVITRHKPHLVNLGAPET
jgi:hypothetical protein